MKLDTPDDRYKFVKAMSKRAFNFQEDLINDKENVDDWIGAVNAVEHLSAINELILAENIFYRTMEDISDVHSQRGANQLYRDIVYENMVRFIDMVLLRRIEITADFINGWDFNLESGERFKKYLSKRLDMLINKYQDLYDL